MKNKIEIISFSKTACLKLDINNINFTRNHNLNLFT